MVDEVDVLNSVKRGLQARSFEVDAFDDPLQALHHFKKNTYEIALLDIRMPKMNGFQLYREILRRDSSEVGFFTVYEEFREEFRKAFPELDDHLFIRTLAKLAQILLSELQAPDLFMEGHLFIPSSGGRGS